jgi:hypothetical protein
VRISAYQRDEIFGYVFTIQSTHVDANQFEKITILLFCLAAELGACIAFGYKALLRVTPHSPSVLILLIFKIFDLFFH